MGNVIFKCPHTGLNVQHWLDDTEPENPSSAYDTVVSKACSRFHSSTDRAANCPGSRKSVGAGQPPHGEFDVAVR
jgi:hypothetical protein